MESFKAAEKQVEAENCALKHETSLLFSQLCSVFGAGANHGEGIIKHGYVGVQLCYFRFYESVIRMSRHIDRRRYE